MSHQGDPLSPLLFCLAEEVLNRGIQNLVAVGHVQIMVGPWGAVMPTHVFFADDLMVFCCGTRQSHSHLMALFKNYRDRSGQWINPAKCVFYHGGLPRKRTQIITAILGFLAGQIPFKYLRVPIFFGKPRRTLLMPIIDCVLTKLASSKGKLLSIMGRTQLVKSIIHGMLWHTFLIYP